MGLVFFSAAPLICHLLILPLGKALRHVRKNIGFFK